MFQVGDKVVYPMHGAGVIEAIEEREVLGKTRQYYVMHLPVGNMKVFVPLDSVHTLGLRQVISRTQIQEVLAVLQLRHQAAAQTWNRRYRANLEKIRGGNILDVAEVVRNLALRDREKGLSTGEKKMYASACQILVSELVLAEETEEAAVRELLEKILA